MSQKLEDGIYIARDDRLGHTTTAFVVDGKVWGWRNATGGYSVECDNLRPLRRIATLDGTPVVGKEVIEALAKEMRDEMYSLVDASFSMDWFIAILRKHLATENREAGGECSRLDEALGENADLERERDQLKARVNLLEKELSECGEVMQRMHPAGELKHIGLLEVSEAMRQVEKMVKEQSTNHYRENATGDVWVFLSQETAGKSRLGIRCRDKDWNCFSAENFARDFTPIAPPDEPIVRLPGAFVCWDRKGDEHTAWPDDEGKLSVLSHRGYFDAAYEQGSFGDYFTRTPPTTLTPAQEAEAQRLAKFSGKPIDEARRFLAGQGAVTSADG